MIFITGDTHIPLDIRKLNSKNFAEGKTMSKNDYVIITGDCGLFWYNVQDATERYWLDWLNNKKFSTLFVDGNHENHHRLFSGIVANEDNYKDIISDCYKVEKKFGGFIGRLSDSVYHLRRGEIYTIDNKKFFVMGGAYSIDKFDRTLNKSWWKEEEPNYNEFDHGLENLKNHNNIVDYIIGHTAPGNIIRKYIDKYFEYDSVSKFFDNIINFVRFDRFFCGHWHIDRNYDNYNFLFNDVIRI